jgi:mannosyltransferase OCH1-like enzyme
MRGALLAACLGVLVCLIVLSCMGLRSKTNEIPLQVFRCALEKSPIIKNTTIFQTVASLALTSPRLRKIMQELQARNPTWGYRLYEDEDIDEYVRLHWAGTKEERAFFSLSRDYGAARADLWRYLIIYQHGGFYADAKTMCTQPLGDLVGRHQRGDVFAILHYWMNCQDSRAFIGNTKGEIGQFYLLYSAGHPLLRAVLDRVVANIERYKFEKDGGGKTAVLKLTGPHAYTKAIEQYLSENSDVHHSFLSSSDEGIYYSAFDYSGNFNGAHETMYGRDHYSQRQTPVVIHSSL